jgi:signal peptidase I
MVSIAVILAILIQLFIFQPVRVEGNSMTPTLQDSDIIIISKIGRTLNQQLKHDQIIVFDRRMGAAHTLLDEIKELGIFNRFENRNLLIKRLIGLPGDIISIKDGQVYRNGVILDEPYLTAGNGPGMNDTYLVPEDHIFVLGDNRNNSLDSWIIGYIPIKNIKGTMAVDISSLLRETKLSANNK